MKHLTSKEYEAALFSLALALAAERGLIPWRDAALLSGKTEAKFKQFIDESTKDAAKRGTAIAAEFRKGMV